MLRLGVPPNMVDILNFAEGEEFHKVFSRKVSGMLGDIEVFYPNRTDLIHMKKATGRLQDLANVESLEKFGK